MIRGQRFNPPSGVVRKMAMSCGHKFNSPSGVVPKLAMICGQKSNLPSGVVRKLAMISGRKSHHASYVARNLAMIFRHLSGKVVPASQLPVKALVNSFLSLEYKKDLTLYGCSRNCKAEEDQEIEIIERSNCLSIIARDFKKVQSVTRGNQRRKRDREPSRIPVLRILKVLKRKLVRQKNRIIFVHVAWM